MKNTIILRVILLGSLTIAGIIGLQAYWLLSAWSLSQEDFDNKVSLALNNVAKSMAELNGSELPTREIVRQRSPNYYVVNLEDDIDASFLDYYLQKEFANLALNVDFEYGVFDCSSDEMVYGRYISYTPERDKNVALGELPTYKDLNYYFGVKFPTRSGYLWDKMQLSIVFSIILLLTIVFFAYSMLVILRQKRLSELQKDFINNMTHEFKTPISTIRISADTILQDQQIKSSPRLSRYAQIISEQNKRLNHQVERVLQVARIDRDKVDLQLEELSLPHVIRTVIDSIMPSLQAAGGQLDCNLPQDTPLRIRADRVHLMNILHSLIDNAIKYSGSAPDITIEARLDKQRIHLYIKDQGIGIAREHQRQLFEKFYRVPTGDVHNVKGFGLGLYYVKNMCDAHGWTCDLTSEPGIGTTVHIQLPLLSQPIPQQMYLVESGK